MTRLLRPYSVSFMFKALTFSTTLLNSFVQRLAIQDLVLNMTRTSCLKEFVNYNPAHYQIPISSGTRSAGKCHYKNVNVALRIL